MKRREILLAAGTAAAAAGAGTALWYWGAEGDEAAQAQGKSTISTIEDVWKLRFARLDGSTLPLSSFKGKPLILNFWATWCAPCITEMPLLDRFYQQHQAQGWSVLGLALDNSPAVRDFLARRPVGFPIALVGLHGIELIKFLGNTQGGLPFSAVLGAEGDVVQRKLGALKGGELEQWASQFT